MNVTIEKLAYGGDGIARPGADQPVVFVPRAAAGDSLDVEVVEEKPRFKRARILKVIESGPSRVAPPCKHYEGADDAHRCGGCQLQHLDYAGQLAAKTAQVEEAIHRIGGLQKTRFNPAISAPAALGYRNKGTFRFSSEGKSPSFGLIAADSHTVLPIGDCPLLIPAAASLYRKASAAAIAIAVRDPAARASILGLMVRAGEKTGDTMAVLVVRPGHPESLAKEFAAAVDATSVQLNVNPNAGLLLGDQFVLLKGSATIREKIGALTFVFDAETFLQVNTAAAATLYRVAADAAHLSGSENVLDVFCGNGGIALTVAARSKSVIGVETVASAVERGKESALANGIENVRFRLGRAESTLKKLVHAERLKPDVVFVDPPRAGLKPIVVETIAKMRPKRIVYVSCNPTTLARDLKAFAALKYATREVTPVDLFPQTYHVESVALLEADRS